MIKHVGNFQNSPPGIKVKGTLLLYLGIMGDLALKAAVWEEIKLQDTSK